MNVASRRNPPIKPASSPIEGSRSIKLPQHLEARLDSLLTMELHHELTAESVQHVQRAIRTGRLLDYDLHGVAFAYLYFALNFAKSYTYTREGVYLHRSEGIRVLDVGCGAGASAAGVIAALDDMGQVQVSRVVGIDSSIVQLGLFDRLFRSWMSDGRPTTTVKAYSGSAVQFLMDAGPHDIVVMSYLLSELDQDEQARVWQSLLANKALRGAELLVIDRDLSTHETHGWTRSAGSLTFDTSQLRIQLPYVNKFGLPVAPRHGIAS